MFTFYHRGKRMKSPEYGVKNPGFPLGRVSSLRARLS